MSQNDFCLYPHFLGFKGARHDRHIDAYMIDLKNKAQGCEFGNLHDLLIRDRIVCGVREDQVHVIRETDLMLKRATDICRANEMTSNQVKVLTEEIEVKIRSVKHLKKADRTKAKSSPALRKTRMKMNENDKKAQSKCSRCGYEHGPKKCPAYGKTFVTCNKKKHFVKNQATGARTLHMVETEEEDDFFYRNY